MRRSISKQLGLATPVSYCLWTRLWRLPRSRKRRDKIFGPLRSKNPKPLEESYFLFHKRAQEKSLLFLVVDSLSSSLPPLVSSRFNRRRAITVLGVPGVCFVAPSTPAHRRYYLPGDTLVVTTFFFFFFFFFAELLSSGRTHKPSRSDCPSPTIAPRSQLIFGGAYSNNKNSRFHLALWTNRNEKGFSHWSWG